MSADAPDPLLSLTPTKEVDVRKTFSVEEVTAAQPDRDWSIIDGELVTTTPIDISDGIDEAEAAFAGRALAQRKRETEEAAKALNVRKTTKRKPKV